ncbi:MAG: hypothetical protein IKK24_00295, partial [Clostridia bacterium]|nr:hypothetical protein [Clostridia bacterium]
MNEVLKNLAGRFKNPKLIIIIGICGILLIFISSFFDTDTRKTTEPKNSAETLSTEDYRLSLENGVSEIVKSITGDS